MDFHAYADQLGTPFWDFHRANLHLELLNRAKELGADITTNARVVDVQYESAGEGVTRSIAVLGDGRRRSADLIVGADGINSKCREILLGKPDPPLLTGDLAYRLLLNTEDMIKDPELRGFIEDPQVNYWMGPDAHAGTLSLPPLSLQLTSHKVNYVLRGGKLFNMVLLVPDDLPADANTLAGNVDEMRALYQNWDPRISKLLLLCDSVTKWRLCIRPGLDPTWSHASGAFTILGDAAHATLPYLASGAGMSLEDGHVLGLCLGKLNGTTTDAQKKTALDVYERCRRRRTERVVARGTTQQHLYHVHDGPDQIARDDLLRAYTRLGNSPATKDMLVDAGLKDEGDPFPWRWEGCGKWLLTYICEDDVEARWEEVAREAKKDGVEVRAVL
ncbi:FAD/NAD(P)-binding domain-containing protein [Periconia macrospinosa]|uniref:FAD/NAD(P)-binding domain-containing protein n=1 Tax=Periconia macrospinosa TaxID=97972 RepID=A0A2V1DTF2_9PLEO|nr:FAD/NAD(P)-binding domain-containing protein [Periconia macrospinosa]